MAEMGIAAKLAAAEGKVAGIRVGCEKQIVWAGAQGAKTRQVVVYIHGFVASPGELRPVPDLVAKALGANLFFTRLDGHGLDGAAMAVTSFAAWQADLDEAFSVAAALGDEVILMGCSTGCTLIADALARGHQAKAAVLVSPNFGLRNRVNQLLLEMPFSRHWSFLVAGKTQVNEVLNPDHARFWTTSYPTVALYPVIDAMRAVRRADLSKVTTPAMVAMNENDQVVRPAAMRRTMARWGGAVTHLPVVISPECDALGHVIAGDVYSPKQTAPMAEKIVAWLQNAAS